MNEWDKMLKRPNWDDYFMALAFVISQRSIDPHSKLGTVVVDSDNTIISVGYNSPPRGCLDHLVPLTRPEKYDWMVHSEEAAILNAARNGVSLKGSKFYVTGRPCSKCIRAMLSVGVVDIIYGPISPVCVDDKEMAVIELMMRGQSVTCSEYEGDFKNVLKSTMDYIKRKEEE